MHSAVQNWEDPTERQATLLAFWQREHGRRIRLAQEESDLAGGRIGWLGRVAIWGRRIGDRLLHADENGHSVDGWRISSFRFSCRRRQESYTDENGVTWTREENYTDENRNEHEMWYAPEEWEPPEEWFAEDDDSLGEIVMVVCTKGDDTEPDQNFPPMKENGNGDEHGSDACNDFLAELQ
jgi:hypothetical protein